MQTQNWWMTRQRGSKSGGGNWTEAEINGVWTKGLPAAGYNPAFVRTDGCGALIERSRHGDTNSTYGWEIDHIVPSSQGGGDIIANLQPLHWENNRAKGEARWSA